MQFSFLFVEDPEATAVIKEILKQKLRDVVMPFWIIGTHLCAIPFSSVSFWFQ